MDLRILRIFHCARNDFVAGIFYHHYVSMQIIYQRGEEEVNILIYGAGVLGSLYAMRLQLAGQNVSILARGARLADLRNHGILLEDPTGKCSTVHANAVDSLASDDAYDLVMVFVRGNQVAGILPVLALNRLIPSILFMVNNVSGFHAITAAVGPERVLWGFAGAGGARQGHIIRAAVLPRFLQPTSVAELDGQFTPRVRKIAQILRSAGFPTVIRKNMDAWLKSHAALVSPIANAIYRTGGDIHQLAKDRQTVQLMLHAIKEGFQVLHALDIPITPFSMRILEIMPEPMILPLIQRVLDTRAAELVIERHANAARDEMKQIAEEYKALAYASRISTPSIDALRTFI